MLRSAYPHAQVAKRKTFRLGAAIVLVSVLSVAGCASRAPTYVRAPIYKQPTQVPAPARVAGYREQRVVIEDDGMEAQSAPPFVRKPVVDDPTEPFSPNYGRFIPLKRADAGGPRTYIPNDLPEDFPDRLAKSVSGT